MVRAGRDFDAFYKQRTSDAETSESKVSLMILSFDGKGVVVHKEDLREATRKAAERRRKKLGNSIKIIPIFRKILHTGSSAYLFTIIDDLKRGGTLLHASGIYEEGEKKVIFTNVNRRELILLEKFIKEIDKDAFLTVFEAKEIIGKGFRSLNEI